MHALELGVNFFDSAQVYGWGEAERALGKAITGRRDEVVICTKTRPCYTPKDGEEPKYTSFSRDFLFHQVNESLQRLDIDFIDLYLLHMPDRLTPMEEISDTMHALVRSGKIRFWGVSNFSAEQVASLAESSEGRSPIAGTEDYYNLAGITLNEQGKSRVRQLETEMFPLMRDPGLGLMTYSPLDAGTLASDYQPDPDTASAALLQKVDRVADELGVSRTQVCIAWVLSHPEVTSVISGAENSEHLEENLAGARLELSLEAVNELNDASSEFSRRWEEENRPSAN